MNLFCDLNRLTMGAKVELYTMYSILFVIVGTANGAP